MDANSYKVIIIFIILSTMIKYDYRYPEDLYKDIIENFNYDVKHVLKVYINVKSDDQEEIKKKLKNNNLELLTIDNIIYVNILMNIQYENENKWLLCKACCNPFFGTLPYSFLGGLDLLQSEELLNGIFLYLIYNNEIRKICNCCDNKAIYNCPECDNLDFCEECVKENMHEKINLTKYNEKEKIGELCDICGKKIPSYTNKKYYCMCEDCFQDNPHKNHKLVKINYNDNLLSDDELIIKLKKKIYIHYAYEILNKYYQYDKIKKWDIYEEDNRCCIFNNKNKTVKNRVNFFKIEKRTLDELKKIELEYGNYFDKLIRKFFVYEQSQYNFLYGDNVPLYCKESIANFYFDAIDLINKVKYERENKKQNDIMDNNEEIVL